MLTPKNKEIFDVKSISFKKVLVTPPPSWAKAIYLRKLKLLQEKYIISRFVDKKKYERFVFKIVFKSQITCINAFQRKWNQD